jgi:GNAT superfamily N-acetyltransferase
MNEPSLATTAEEIARCYPVVRELRPHLGEAEFVEQVLRQQANERYHLAYLTNAVPAGAAEVDSPSASEMDSRVADAGGAKSDSVVPKPGSVVAVAGYRFMETLAWGRVMYVDDLVTASSARGGGFGGRMIAWLKATAHAQGCQEFHLDSGVHRFAAHRFYFRHGLEIRSFHFSKMLED